MEDILMFILQCLWELVLQALFELLFELFCHVINGFYEKIPDSFFAVIVYTFLGAVAGILSLWLVPHAFIHRESLRIVNVIITPILVAALMVGVGVIRTRKGQEIIRLDKFRYAYLFALIVALMRFKWAL